MGISWDPIEFNHSHSRPASLPFPFPFPCLLNCNFHSHGNPMDSHSHGNPTPMHTSTLKSHFFLDVTSWKFDQPWQDCGPFPPRICCSPQPSTWKSSHCSRNVATTALCYSGPLLWWAITPYLIHPSLDRPTHHPNSICIQSAVLPQYTFWTHRHTHTDRQMG